MPVVSVVVVFHKLEPCVYVCLDSVLSMEYPFERLEVIAVDDTQNPDTADLLHRRYPVVRVISNGASRGCDGSKQVGIDAATGDVIALTDADCTVSRRWARVLAQGLMDGAEVVTGPVRHPRTPLRELIGVADFQDSQSTRPRWVSIFPGCNFAARREIISRMGYQAREMRFGSDRLFSWALYARGLRIRFEPDMEVQHAPEVRLSDLVERRLRYGRKALALRRMDPSLPGSIITRPGLLAPAAYVCYKTGKDMYRLAGMVWNRIVNPWHVPLLIPALIAFRLLDAVGILMESRKPAIWLSGAHARTGEPTP